MTKKHVWKIDDIVKERNVKTIWYECEHYPFTMVIRNVFAGTDELYLQACVNGDTLSEKDGSPKVFTSWEAVEKAIDDYFERIAQE